MNLIIDIGNSLSKVALFEDGRIEKSANFKIFNSSILKDFLKDRKIKCYILASVKQKDTELVDFLTANYQGIDMINSTPIPIKLNYSSPETLGIDRIAISVAAAKKYANQPSLIISFGSCITYNFINSDQNFQGGAISPGIYMRLKAMNAFTDKLPLLNWDGVSKPSLFANTTEKAILSGAINGALNEVNGIIKHYKTTFGSEINIIFCGGDANFFDKELKNGIFADANFALYGLNEILQYNS